MLYNVRVVCGYSWWRVASSRAGWTANTQWVGEISWDAFHDATTLVDLAVALRKLCFLIDG